MVNKLNLNIATFIFKVLLFWLFSFLLFTNALADNININANVISGGGGGAPALEDCRDGNDNDGDGLIDYPLDPGCANPQDTSEVDSPAPPPVACGDSIDNDGDGLIDYPLDPGCTSALDGDETDPVTPPQCNDTLDNDGDSLIDYPLDPGCASASDNDETDVAAKCADSIDNDGDGLIDYPLDPGCSSLTDNDETDPVTQCNNGLDDDGDGLIDYPNDPGCDNLADTDETDPPTEPECSDTLDNDADSFIDYPNDPGCASASDDDETDALPECSDGADNDSDLLVDYPNDPGCNSELDDSEIDPATQCNNGLDDDGDSLVDYPVDPGCSNLFDNSELDPTECLDTIDNDGDGLIDYPNDPGCSSPADDDETSPIQAQCSDGVDNDGDGLVDYPNDPGCINVGDNDEFNLTTALPQCSDGVDNDGDGLVDYPNDPGCVDAADDDEVDGAVIFDCNDGNDNDGDGLVDYPNDPGCDSFSDNDEFNLTTALPQCSDGVDNDGDGLVDYPNDPGCVSASDDDEMNAVEPPIGGVTQCSDGIDNDGDGFIDYPADSGCRDIYDKSETDIVEDIIDVDVVGVVQELVDISESALLNITGNLAAPVIDFINDPLVEQATEEVVAPTVIVVATGVVGTSFSLFNLLAYLRYFFTQPLAALWRRRRKKWGVVYNSITKQPIDLAIVRLYLAEGEKLFRSRVTDKAGRYSFLVPPGKYYIQVTKPKFVFPTEVLSDRSEDQRFLDLYHGEVIEVKEKDTLITVNIPIDQVTDAVPDKKVVRDHYLRLLQKMIAFSAIPIALVTVVVSPSKVTLSALAIHIVLFILFYRLGYQKRPKSWGIIYDLSSRRALPRSVVRIYDKEYNKLLETQMADAKGRYSFLVGDNVYYLTSDKPGYSQHRSTDINLIDKEADLVVGLDIPMQKITVTQEQVTKVGGQAAEVPGVGPEALKEYIRTDEPEIKATEAGLPKSDKPKGKPSIAEQVKARRQERFKQAHGALEKPEDLKSEFDLEKELQSLKEESKGLSTEDTSLDNQSKKG